MKVRTEGEEWKESGESASDKSWLDLLYFFTSLNPPLMMPLTQQLDQGGHLD